jgi:D-alanine-D-alanine ligase-like ATP-grasp enzyme
MAQLIIRQYFGPSARCDRACVELTFAMAPTMHRLAPFEPMLAQHGFKLSEYLPDEPLPLDQAVCRLAGAMLASATLALPAPWWSSHGVEDDRGWVAIAHPLPQAAAISLDAASGLLLAGDDHEPRWGAADRLSEWHKTAMKTRLLILAAADLYGIDSAHLNDLVTLFQLGQGAKGLHFEQSCNEHDTATGTFLDQNKLVTCMTLRRLGLPATRGVLARSEDAVKRAIGQVGLPCVVKPLAMNKGTGVATFLRSEAQVLAAFAHVRALSDQPALIENHVEGDDHRIMVVGDELLWAYRKDPSTVTGDGIASIGELIARENDRRAAIRSGTEAYLYPIATDEEFTRFLADRYDMDTATVLPAGTSILVASQANIARGGILHDVTGMVHPDNRAMAIRAARLIRTRTMGVDFVTPDISRSWRDVPCAIVEVNRSPAVSGLGDASLLVRTTFPNHRTGRIPTLVVIGTAAHWTAAANVIASACQRHGLRAVGTTYSARGATEDLPILQATLAPPVETLMLDPEADVALVLCTPEKVERLGFPLRRCDLLIVQDEAPPAWQTQPAETVLRGAVSPAAIEQAIDQLVRTYADPAEGGARPVLEPIDAGADEFRLKVWRARAMPREWFWAQVGAGTDVAPSQAIGLTTHDDLLGAVRALADGGRGGLVDAFSYGDLIGSWFRVTFEAALPLPVKQRAKALAALLAATERVNAIVAGTL